MTSFRQLQTIAIANGPKQEYPRGMLLENFFDNQNKKSFIWVENLRVIQENLSKSKNFRNGDFLKLSRIGTLI